MKSWLIGKDLEAGNDWGQEKGTSEVGWNHWWNAHEFEQSTEDSEGQWRLGCFSSWGCKESDTTQWLNNSNEKLTCIQISVLIKKQTVEPI